jgi:flagellar motor switch protein FliM
MDQITQTRDENSCDHPEFVSGVSAWKSFAGQMAGSFPTALSQLLRGRGQLRGACVSRLQTKQFRDVLRALAYGRMYSWTLDSGDEGCIWLGLDTVAAAAMIDLILGGRPYQGVSGDRALTAIDRRLLARVIDRAGGLVASLAGIPQPLSQRQIDQAPELLPEVSAVCFDLEIGGAMWLFVDSDLHTDQKLDAGKAGHRAKGGPIELSATLNVAEIAPDQLAALEIGDVISTDASVDVEVTVRLAGIPKYIGQLSTVDGKKAITITRKINDQD